MAQPSEESSSVAATPPCTDPIGLYIHSCGVTAKITRPGSTSVISKSSSEAIGGGGSSPAAILRMASIPGSSAAACAVIIGSAQVKLRARCVMQPSLAAIPHRPPGLPRDPQDDERDHEADDRVGGGQAERDDDRAGHHREADEPVRARVVAVGDERRALEPPSGAEADRGRPLVAEEADDSRERQR